MNNFSEIKNKFINLQNEFNENVKDLTLIAFGTDESIIKFKPIIKRQEETVTSGRKELKEDYYETLKIIKGK